MKLPEKVTQERKELFNTHQSAANHIKLLCTIENQIKKIHGSVSKITPLQLKKEVFSTVKTIIMVSILRHLMLMMELMFTLDRQSKMKKNVQHQPKFNSKVMTIAPKTTNVMLEKVTVIPTMVAKLVLSVVKEKLLMMFFQDSLDGISYLRLALLDSMETTAMTLTSIKRLLNVIQIGLTHLQFKLIIWVTHPALKENNVILVKVIVMETLIAR